LEWVAHGEVLSAEDFGRFHATGNLWVALHEGRPGGFLAAQTLDGNLHIRELSVSQECQGRGMGRLLIETAMAAARQRGMPALTLTTFRQVPWNAPFYIRCGFRLLDRSSLSQALADVLADEEAHGMPSGSRCAMRLDLV
jgi:GNAT superfamily N-acetyltransferase